MTSILNKTSLSEKIAEVLAKEARHDYAAGDRLPAESAMAKRFGVSVITVREALGMLEQNGLIERRHGSGTYVADHQTNAHVAVLSKLDLFHPHTSFFYRMTSQQVVARLHDLGIKARIYSGRMGPGETGNGEIPEAFLDSLKRHRVRGIVSLAAPDRRRLQALAKEENLPVVGDDAAYPWNVSFDRSNMVRQGVEELFKAGRRKIALLAWQNTGDLVGEQDSVVFCREMTRLGLPIHEPWIRQDLHPNSVGSGWFQMKAIWESGPDKPDGLLICDDLLYRDASMAILALGIEVPGRLKVISHANQGSGIFYPFPTKLIQFDASEFASVMCELLLEQIQNPGASKEQARVLAINLMQTQSPARIAPSNFCAKEVAET